MKKLLMIISLLAINGCSTTNEYIIIENMQPERVDSAIIEIIEEKYSGY